IRQFPVDDVQVGAAHTTRCHTNPDFAACRPRIGRFHKPERCARPFQHHCLHVGKSIAPLASREAAPRGGATVSYLATPSRRVFATSDGMRGVRILEWFFRMSAMAELAIEVALLSPSFRMAIK